MSALRQTKPCAAWALAEEWEQSMSAYDLDTIVKKWGREELTTEQAIGQILLLLQTVSYRVGRLEVAQENNRKQDKLLRKKV
jgi:hypothetical protein